MCFWHYLSQHLANYGQLCQFGGYGLVYGGDRNILVCCCLLVTLASEWLCESAMPCVALLLLVLVQTQFACATMIKSNKYSAMTSSSGSAVCAVDQPTVSISMSGSAGRCAAECMTSRCCPVFQFDSGLNQCMLYDFVPLNYTACKQRSTFIVRPTCEFVRLITQQ